MSLKLIDSLHLRPRHVNARFARRQLNVIPFTTSAANYASALYTSHFVNFRCMQPSGVDDLAFLKADSGASILSVFMHDNVVLM